MASSVRWTTLFFLLASPSLSLTAGEPVGPVGIGIGITQGAGNSQGPWSLGEGERGLYGRGGCLDFSWQTARDGVFQARPRLTWFSLGTGDTLRDGGGFIQAKVHGYSVTCDLMFHYFRDSAHPFYFFVGPGLNSYTTRILSGEVEPHHGRGEFEVDVGIGLVVSRLGEIELRYTNTVDPFFSATCSYWTGCGLDDSPNYFSLVLRARF